MRLGLTSVIILKTKFQRYLLSVKLTSHLINWFAANKLVLNLNKTNIMKFITTNSPNSALCISYKKPI